MTALTHQWNHRYTTPIRGQALKAARPGYHIALAIGEIQDTITAIKAANDETPHQWVARFPIPHNLQTISRNRPGTYISLSLGEIQSVVDGMTGISQGDKLPASLLTAYSEHRQVLGGAAYDPGEEVIEPAAYQWTHRYSKPSTGEVIHIARPGFHISQVITEIQDRLSALPPSDDSESVMEEMQTWLEANCTSFVDSTSGPLTPAGDAFLYYTLDSWRTAAGIEDRPLNIEELQAGFNALMWSAQTLGSDNFIDKFQKNIQGGGITKADAYADAVAKFDAASWDTVTTWYYAAVGRFTGPSGYPGWGVWLWRARSTIQINLWGGIPRSLDLYTKDTDYEFGDSLFYAQGDYITGVSASIIFKKVLSISASQSNPITYSHIAGNAAPEISDVNGQYYGWKLGYTGIAKALFKWNFTTA